MNLLRRKEYETEGEDSERYEADEEGDHDSAEHENHLLPGTRVAGLQVFDGRINGFCHQMTCHDGVEYDEDKQGKEEEDGNDHDEVAGGPESVGLRQTSGHTGAIYVLHMIVILGDQQDRTDDHTEFKRFILIS